MRGVDGGAASGFSLGPMSAVGPTLSAMTRVVYFTATSLNGFIAESTASGDSLEWLFEAEPAPEPELFADFLAPIGAIMMGSSTYRWILENEEILEHPERWEQYHGKRPVFVFSTREQPVPEGVDVRVVSGGVGELFAEIEAAAGGRDIWISGGGELAGQFYDAGLLTELQFTFAPVALPAGAPLLPRRIPASRLSLRSLSRHGVFAHLVYELR